MTFKNRNIRPTIHTPSTRLRRLVSACSLPDIAIWELVSRQVPLYISADEYLLICPPADLAEFSSRTAKGWTIVDDESFCQGYGHSKIQEIAHGTNRRRAGWLLQQFVKINACADPTLQADDLVLIWDADTIPLRIIDFIDEETGVIRYYHSQEHHMPYFETIQRDLGIAGSAGLSFIAQCFATRAGWAREFIDHIEQRAGMNYIEHIVRSLPGKSESEFSEYETMGTWNLTHHADQIAFTQRGRWTRNGARWIGHNPQDALARFLLRLMALRYDYVAVEKWQRPLRSVFRPQRDLSSYEKYVRDEMHAQPMKERMSQP